MVATKHAFWQALLFTFVIFGLGLAAGYLLEFSRSSEIEKILARSEIALLDEQLRAQTISGLNVSCDAAINATFAFADSIYQEAAMLERYDSASKFSDEFITLHHRYDLLRTMLWLQSMELKKRCGDSFHTVVYLYEYNPDDLTVRAKQTVFSRVLQEVKYNDPESILLIPIAANTDVETLSLIAQHYKVERYPSIVIDESVVVTEVMTADALRTVVFEGHN